MNSSIVITGASGFIGKYLMPAFLSKGYSLCAVIRSEGKKNELVEFLEKNGTDISNLSFVVSDLKEVSSDKFDKTAYDAWFHLAWGGVNRDGINDYDIQEENVVFSKQCLKCASDLKCSFFADLGSRAEYPGDAGIIEETVSDGTTGKSIQQHGSRTKPVSMDKTAAVAHEMRIGNFKIVDGAVMTYGVDAIVGVIRNDAAAHAHIIRGPGRKVNAIAAAVHIELFK